MPNNKHLETDGLPTILLVPRTDPIYNCHSYLTKVPVGAITPFIETFTQPGDLVADIFAGSGMTGIAARIKSRNAVLSDISALGQHVATGYLTNVKEAEYREAALQCIQRAQNAVGDLYTTLKSKDGAKTHFIRLVWSFVYECPHCHSDIIYYDLVMKSGKKPDSCQNCNGMFVKRELKKIGELPVEVVVENDTGRQVAQDIQKYDRIQLELAASDVRLQYIPSSVIDGDREMFKRSALGKHGLNETKDFFTPRNSIALLELYNAINLVTNQSIRKKLLFAFTAILPRASKRYQWSAKRPLNAQNQTYYIAPIFYEWNIFELFNRKVNAAVSSDKFIFRNGNSLFDSPTEVNYHLTSADDLQHLDDNSVDYIFTDPPFGSNIFYSDMNLFYEVWIGSITDYRNEAVVHTTGRRKENSKSRYEELLKGSFKEAYRVLKPGKYMSLVFGNSSGTIWNLVQRALSSSGFDPSPVHVAILDKGQRSVKGLNSGSEGVVTIDLILTVKKPINVNNSFPYAESHEKSLDELLPLAIKEISENDRRNPSYIYSAVIREAIRNRMTLENLHLSDILLNLRSSGYVIDSKSGLLTRPVAIQSD